MTISREFELQDSKGGQLNDSYLEKEAREKEKMQEKKINEEAK